MSSEGNKPVGLIAAVAANGIIGADNKLPWRSSEDLRNFARTTMGQVVIVGRKTYESIGGPLKGRMMIVLTRQRDVQLPGCEVCTSLADAIKAAQQRPAREVWIAGGAQIYEQAMPHADRLLVTHMNDEYQGDSLFPAIDPKRWRCASESPSQIDNNFVVRDYLPNS